MALSRTSCWCVASRVQVLGLFRVAHADEIEPDAPSMGSYGGQNIPPDIGRYRVAWRKTTGGPLPSSTKPSSSRELQRIFWAVPASTCFSPFSLMKRSLEPSFCAIIDGVGDRSPPRRNNSGISEVTVTPHARIRHQG